MERLRLYVEGRSASRNRGVSGREWVGEVKTKVGRETEGTERFQRDLVGILLLGFRKGDLCQVLGCEVIRQEMYKLLNWNSSLTGSQTV